MFSTCETDKWMLNVLWKNNHFDTFLIFSSCSQGRSQRIERQRERDRGGRATEREREREGEEGRDRERDDGVEQNNNAALDGL